MTLLVETGEGVDGANSYLSIIAFKSYADARGLSYLGQQDIQIEQALVRASAWIDATYRSRFPGARTNGRGQGLQWPRMSIGAFDEVTDGEGLPIDDDELPAALLNATAEAAYRELLTPGGLSPDLERGGDIRRIQAGSVAIEYATTAAARTTFTIIDGLLADILVASEAGGGFTARAVRA